jgi:hypothetical protein
MGGHWLYKNTKFQIDMARDKLQQTEKFPTLQTGYWIPSGDNWRPQPVKSLEQEVLPLDADGDTLPCERPLPTLLLDICSMTITK